MRTLSHPSRVVPLVLQLVAALHVFLTPLRLPPLAIKYPSIYVGRSCLLACYNAGDGIECVADG